ncbi:MAG: hypothetical protein CYG60_19405 [Actinobacteria bacterium]|nr:CbtA family protein [Actinomycetota bacterium]PLS84158.1 MAG: hypothetical protein CYG60_19405 [Actinomycetota bacterium]
MVSISAYLRRGMVAGLLAGLLAGLFAFFVGEPYVDGAIRLEEAAGGGGEEVFGRATQRAGLFLATGLFGVTVGGVFGLVYAYFRGRLSLERDWYRSLSLAAALFAGVFLIPFVKYPANPPTVGDPATIGERTVAYFAMVGLSVLVVLSAWLVARWLKGRGFGAPARQTVVGLGVLAAVTVLFAVLPSAPDPGSFPSGMLWGFRLSSLGTQAVFWAGLGAVFGILCERANRRRAL